MDKMTIVLYTSCILALFTMNCSANSTTNSDPTVALAVALQEPFSRIDPAVEITYTNVSTKSVVFYCPEDGTLFYRGMKMFIDGEECAYRDDHPAVAHVVFTNSVTLQQGDSISFTVRINSIWKLPEKWDRMELRPTGIHAPSTRKGYARLVGDTNGAVFDSSGKRIKASGGEEN